MARILVLTKRQYMSKDLLDDRFGRFREIPFELALQGHEVKGLCLSYISRGNGIIQDGPVAWESIDVTASIVPGISRFLFRSAQLVKTVDFVWACSDSFYGVIACFLGRKYGVPVVFDLYDNFEFYLAARLPVIKQLYRCAVLTCDAVTCVSRPLAGLVRTYGRRDGITVLENSVRKDLFQPMAKDQCRSHFGLPQQAFVVGTAGALSMSHGVQHLFQAFFLLKKRCPSLHLLLAGPRGRGFAIPADPNIHDAGLLKLEEVPRLLNALDVAVICNLENEFGKYCFPQKAREIMACGVPLIAARVGAMKELLHGNPEWLYSPEDPEDLARALEHRFGERTTDYGDVISWTDAASRLDEVMRSFSKDR